METNTCERKNWYHKTQEHYKGGRHRQKKRRENLGSERVSESREESKSGLEAYVWTSLGSDSGSLILWVLQEVYITSMLFLLITITLSDGKIFIQTGQIHRNMTMIYLYIIRILASKV